MRYQDPNSSYLPRPFCSFKGNGEDDMQSGPNNFDQSPESEVETSSTFSDNEPSIHIPEKNKNIHPKSRDHLLERELLSRPSFQYYDALDLSRLVVSCSQQPIFAHLAASEIPWLSTDQIDFSHPWTPEEIWSYLQKWGLMLDKIFFFGLVSLCVNLRYDSETVDGGATVGTFRPTNAFVDEDRDAFKNKEVKEVQAGTISIHSPFKLPRFGNEFEAKMVGFVGHLVHEMLHAFLVMFACNCTSSASLRHRPRIEEEWSMKSGCRGGCKELNNRYDRLGELGHGEAWCDAMFAIQSALRRDLGSLPSSDSLSHHPAPIFTPSSNSLFPRTHNSTIEPNAINQACKESDRMRENTKRLWAELDCNIGGLRSDMKAVGYEPSPQTLRRWGLEYKDESSCGFLRIFGGFLLVCGLLLASRRIVVNVGAWAAGRVWELVAEARRIDIFDRT